MVNSLPEPDAKTEVLNRMHTSARHLLSSYNGAFGNGKRRIILIAGTDPVTMNDTQEQLNPDFNTLMGIGRHAILRHLDDVGDDLFAAWIPMALLEPVDENEWLLSRLRDFVFPVVAYPCFHTGPTLLNRLFQKVTHAPNVKFIQDAEQRLIPLPA